MNDVKIIPMGNNHINDVFEISSQCFTTSWSKQSIEDEVSNGLARYFIAVLDNKVVGYGGLWIIIDEAHITNIAVLPEYRKRNIGTLLLKKLIELSIKENIVGMTLEVRHSNLAAQALYEHFNFKVEGVRKGYYADNREDAIIMWKRDFNLK